MTWLKKQLEKAKKSIDKSISKSFITGCSWALTNDVNNHVLYTFKNNGELLITTNGNVIRASYELIIDNNSVLITKDNNTEHYNIVHREDDFLFLNKVSTNILLTLVNQTKIKDGLKNRVKKIAQQMQVTQKSLDNEKSRYTINPNDDIDFPIVTIHALGKKHNIKSVFDTIDFMEKNAKKLNISYDTWLRYNPNKSRLDFGDFLVAKGHYSLD